jgi:hypothetical protein
VSGTLRCYSFHSVKGGVGKSTLSVTTALHKARQGARVTLIDMDLTGTSLADVLGLEAPSWEGVAPTQVLPLTRAPTGFLPYAETVKRMEQREQFKRERMEENPASHEARQARGVPFLNDYLLFTTPDWDAREDVHLGSLLWRRPGAPASFEVIPSSALPADLEQTIPAVFDENYSGFLEGRLEYLLGALVPEEDEERVVVLDTPPTVPGLSRAVLSLAFRLADRDPKVELSEDGGMPERLRNARVHWKAFMVGTLDRQDLRAMNRWVSLVRRDEARHLQCLVNRVPPGDAHQLRDLLLKAVKEEELDQLLESAIVVDEDRSLQFFRSEATPEAPPVRLKFLEEAEKPR